jgi:hypothetical protein
MQVILRPSPPPRSGGLAALLATELIVVVSAGITQNVKASVEVRQNASLRKAEHELMLSLGIVLGGVLIVAALGLAGVVTLGLWRQ